MIYLLITVALTTIVMASYAGYENGKLQQRLRELAGEYGILHSEHSRLKDKLAEQHGQLLSAHRQLDRSASVLAHDLRDMDFKQHQLDGTRKERDQQFLLRQSLYGRARKLLARARELKSQAPLTHVVDCVVASWPPELNPCKTK